MLDFVLEKFDLWHNLAALQKPLILYGMGDGADKITRVLEGKGIAWTDVFASDEFVRGHSYKGIRVKSFDEICSLYDDFAVLLCFATNRSDVIDRIKRMMEKYTVFAPDLPVAGDGIFDWDYLIRNADRIRQAYNRLHDCRSKSVFADIINYKLSGKPQYLFAAESDKSEVYTDILCVTQNETYIDAGAYDGDTIGEFLSYTHGRFNQIHAFEPDTKNYRKLVKYTESLKAPGVYTYNKGLYSLDAEVGFDSRGGRSSGISDKGRAADMITLDSLNLSPTIIKLDIEGAESEALKGAERTILLHRPRLYVCAYHRNDDIWKIPIALSDMSYRVYMRHHRYIPAWETNVYGV
ncbi:MAG: FkbM family methyltransferase [Oscillospiraceae bacterium]|nr:FkbM family methyltransferase [Oscillospiraceae bacterium]